MTAKKKPATERPAPPVMVPVPEYVTTCSIPYQVLVVNLPATDAAATTEDSTEKSIRYRETLLSPMDLFDVIAHEALECAKREHVAALEDHDELTRLAHVVAEHFLAWVMAQ